MVLVLAGVGMPATASAGAQERTACPVIVAHRAGGVHAPENTVPGLLADAAAGAAMVEMDVRWSKGDGTAGYPGWPVLMHDPTVDRTTPGSGAVSSMGLTALTALPAQDYAPWNADPQYAAVRVPYAHEFLSAARDAGVRMLLDVTPVPDQYQAAKLMHYLTATGTADDVIYMSGAAGVAAMHGWYPQLRYAVIEYPPAGRMFTAEHLAGLGAGAYAVPFTAVTRGMVDYFHAAGIEVHTWTSDSPAVDVVANWEKMRNAGADFLITNEAGAAMAALGCTVGS